jgi:hypothetical protein
MLDFQYKKIAPFKQAAEAKAARLTEKFTLSDGVSLYTPICFECKHQSAKDPTKCKAYPKGIPVEILTGDANHKKPFKGDHDIQFEQK